MHHQEFASPEALQESIKCLWYTRRDFGAAQSGFEVVPDGYAEIVFHFGEALSVLRDDALQPLPSPFMVGLLASPVHFYASGVLEIIGIRCFPWTVFDLLGLPAGKGDVHIFEHPLARLQPLLANAVKAGDIAGAADAIKAYFLSAGPVAAPDTTLTKAGAAMSGAGGSLPVSGVAAAAHTTVRTLERKFRESSGHTVKDVSGLMRFEQARNRLCACPRASLAGLAQELGYADQSHLSREFKRYSGTTPAAFARKVRQGLPMAGADFVAFVQG